MTEQEMWDALYASAVAQKALAPAAPAGPIVGRFIAVLAVKLAEFWQAHKATLIPVLNTLAIAALDAVSANLGAIKAVNNPGPD